ncbi:MAG TPA: hypothetical protein DEQ34_13970 [Balneolaceae bacterium]|nr:hypothetical protein [Balneolaceae bacterium]|tara:strand:+ start:290801 stop:292318 length:1518 start_codon:yes stop_codon:yes gene_type:complete
MNISFSRLILSLFFGIFLSVNLIAQQSIQRDYSRLMSIPNLIELEASSTHLYALSATEGLAVFRTYPDSLQWLYTSSGMQRRGSTIKADIRFAYQYGDSRRLTVLEPTSVLGVYSSTMLPRPPLGVARLGSKLYIALGEEGLGSLSLKTPETVDSEVEIVANAIIGRANVLDVASSIISNQLFVLTNDKKLHVFTLKDDEAVHSTSVELSETIHSIFVDNELIWGTSNSGDIFEVTADGIGRSLGRVDEKIENLIQWNERVIVRTESGKIWVSLNRRKVTPWTQNTASGNYITKNKNIAWISVFDQLTPLILGESSDATVSDEIEIKPIENKILTYPSPLIFALELEKGSPANVEFIVRSNSANAEIKGQGFYWQPTVNQIGLHSFTVVASNSAGFVDSTSFNVDVRTFNAPPRFSPVRGSSIVANDEYELNFNAIDPENPTNSLIRYLGVDLPDGSVLDEKTGLFTWTPTAQQEGEHTFKVIATDEQGAASSTELTLKVIDLGQ